MPFTKKARVTWKLIVPLMVLAIIMAYYHNPSLPQFSHWAARQVLKREPKGVMATLYAHFPETATRAESLQIQADSSRKNYHLFSIFTVTTPSANQRFIGLFGAYLPWQ